VSSLLSSQDGQQVISMSAAQAEEGIFSMELQWRMAGCE